MKRSISKIDGKEYFKTIAKFSSNTGNGLFSFSEGESYWVRKADESDNCDPKKYVIVKGTFDHSGDAFAHTLNRSSINPYNGTYSFGIAVSKEKCNLVLSYID